MATSLPGNRVQRAVMALTHGLGVKHDSFAAHLAAAWGRNVSREIVSLWASGLRSMPVDAVVELAFHAAAESGEVPAAIAERVLAPLARELGCIVLRLPEAVDDAAGLVARVLTLGGMLGGLQRDVGAALADGHIDDRERDTLAPVIDALIVELTKLKAQIDGEKPGPRAVA